MQAYFNKMVEFVNDASITKFDAEFMPGIMLITLVGVLYIVIKIVLKVLFFKRTLKRCHGININSEHGQLYITTSAISDLIKSMQTTFTHITVNKVNIISVNGNYVIKVRINFDMTGGKLTEQTTALRSKIITDVKEVFGIENISSIDVKLDKTTRPGLKTNTSQPILTPAPAPIAEITPAEVAVSEETIKMSKDDKKSDDSSEATPK